MMHVPSYLDRIGYRGSAAPTRETLNTLIERHQATVPFENIDIVRLHRPILLDRQRHFAKIVDERRGGFCYELNGLLAGLLEALGYGVTLGYGVWPDREGVWTLPFDHLVLVVALPESGERVLVDVGFGAGCPVVAIPLQHGVVHAVEQRGVAAYRATVLSKHSEMWRIDVKSTGADWTQVYDVNATPREIAAFADRCDYLQTSPDSHFTQQLLCTRPVENGRVTLGGDRFILTTDGNRSERPLEGYGDELELLRDWFGIEIDPESYGGAP